MFVRSGLGAIALSCLSLLCLMSEFGTEVFDLTWWLESVC